ncbi:hypothetical protein VNO77_39099 [Canavalia gladiata]|uniref:Receptor-like serine/threonine-protein kinase n=1 Tax=Canavalia gladiata TaxID=3824 RepID=A0AAN9PVI5_CANGL
MVFTEQGKPHVLLVFIYMWLWWSTCNHVKASNNMLKPGDSLNSTGELCSEHNKYCIYFDNLGYLKISTQDDWIVWVANRNQSFPNDSAVLSLDHFGVLKIESKDLKPIILFSSPHPINNTMATLLDTGNFVLQQIQPNGTQSVLLWQSFDYPSDNLIPGMKLGFDHKRGLNWSLVSWLSQAVLDPGPFRLEWEPKRRELVIKQRGQVCWSSGELRDNGFMHNTHYTIVSNENESSFTMTTSNEEHTVWTLLSTGQLINRNEDDNVARADMCYGYNTNAGCQKWEKIPTCRNPGDIFEDKVGYPNPNITIEETNSSYGVSDCKAICWRNCSCVGFTQYHDDGTGCTFFLNSLKGTTIASEGNQFYMLIKTNHHKRKKKWTWIIIAIVTATLIICISILYRVLMKRKSVLEENKRKKMGIEKQDLATCCESPSSNNLDVDLKEEHDLKVFSYASIMEATNGFSSENMLGEGGFGQVYKGILSTGQEVAVKKLSKTSGQGLVEFKNELTLISKLQHTNLVQLLGHCIHQQERILIYEYMPNKSLDFFLFDSTQRKLLDWNKRFSIIEGIAQGLLYLHKYSRLKIIHRDLKASNILLDENMNPKISDFGIARMFTTQDSESNTKRIIGTYGYMSPEYAMEGVFSTKSDVYSFGVLLFEIVSGKRNNSFYTEERPLNLVGHAWELWKEGEVLKLVDPALNDSFLEDEVLRCVHAGLLSVEENADDRPSISNIISMLTNKSKVTYSPKKPAYYLRTKVLLEEETSTKEFGLESMFENSISYACSI